MDVTPSQEMVDEGIAREVVNKIQKLRKKVRRRRSGRERDGRVGDGSVGDGEGWKDGRRR